MIQRLYTQLPDFARPTHPVMRHVLLRARSTRRRQVIRWLLGIIFLLGMVVLGWQVATGFGTVPLDTANSLDKVFLVLYWPLVTLQVIARIFALGSTSGVIATEVQRGTWDTLKITTNGASLAMKTRWAAVFYKLRTFLLVLLLARVVFVVIALIDLTSFQGRYLDLLLSGTTPFGLPDVSKETSVLAGILVTSMMLTASLLAPFTAVALDASIGMWMGTLSRGRLLGMLGQVALIFGRIVLTGFALQLGAVALSLAQPNVWPTEALANSNLLGWLASFFGIAEGDMGLTLLHLPHVQRLWADREYGVLVGVAFLGYTLGQAALANLLVKWAGRRAAKPDGV
jgi:hypothetical protein